MTFQPIKGVIVPTVTPFDESGAVDLSAISTLAQFLIGHGVKGLYPLGTTGEGVLLSNKERKAVAEATVKAADGAVPVIIHTGAITTQDTIDLTCHARDIGADAVAVITPYYFHLSDEALELHFGAVANAVPDFPIYLYKFPAVSGNTISLELVTQLATKYPNIIGLKDSSGDLQTLFATNGLQDGQFNTAIGPDDLILAALAMGVDAAVSGHANVVPEIIVGIYDAVAAGNLEKAQELQMKLNTARTILAESGWHPTVKGVMAKRGVPVGGVRRPLMDVSETAIQTCVAKLKDIGVAI